MEDTRTFDLIVSQLTDAQIEFSVMEHEPVRTSEEAAAIRNVSLASGAKAIIMSTGKGFVLGVMSASRKLNSNPFKKLIGSKSTKFATEEEVWELTKCLPGAVPPFGGIFNIPAYVDQSLIDQGDTINFNAGLRTKSVNMKTQDYINFENPRVGNFTKD